MSKHININVDLNNIVFSTRYAILKTKGKREPYAKELIFKDSLKNILSNAIKNKGDSILIAVDSPNCWRKDLYPEYKSNRDASSDIYFEDVIAAANMIKEFFSTFTSASVVAVDRAEADDIIAVFCQESSEDVHNVVLSSDRDFVQLLDSKTTLYSPVQSKWRESEDPDFDLFVKCIRGDANDFIRSAYPRVRMDVLKEAWEDDYKLLNILETVRKDGRKVGEVFEFNQNLIDLTKQPTHIRESIVAAIRNYVPSKYSEMKAMKYLCDNNLKEFIKMLEYKDKVLKTPVRFDK